MLKKILTLLISGSLFFPFVYAQQPQQVVVGSSYYQQLKANGMLGSPIDSGYMLLTPPDTSNYKPPTSNSFPKSSHCYSYSPPNLSATPVMANVDDGFVGPISFPFTFCFYGTSYTSFYLNSNGNITFDNPNVGFTATGFPFQSIIPTVGDNMIAPFWGDIDFSGSGQCYYEIFADAVIVHWYDAGYYDANSDKVNNMELIFTNGTSTMLSPGSNVGFFYDDMQWTTGDASGGANGFGGVPATVGVNRGNGVDYIQLGRFDQSGTAYDGPFGANDGVDWLDYQYFMFNICTGSSNIQPIISGLQVCDTLHICVGDTMLLDLDFLAPEVGQITTATVNLFGVPGFTTITNTAGNTADVVIELAGLLNNIGPHSINFNVVDNGVPAQSINFSILVEVDTLSIPPPVIVGPDSICPGDSAILTAGSNFESYTWNFGSTDSIVQVPGGLYYFFAEHQGCIAYSDTLAIFAVHPPIPDIFGGPVLCDNSSLTLTTTPGYESYLWSAGDTGLSLTVTDTGFYTVTAFDQYGCSGSDQIYIEPYLYTIPAGNQICGLSFTLTGTQSPGGYWTAYSPSGYSVNINTSTSVLNPGFTFQNEGTYYLIYNDNFCGFTDTSVANVMEYPSFTLQDYVGCVGEIATLTPLHTGSTSGLYYFWSNSANTSYINVAESGIYTLTVANACGAAKDTSFVDIFPCELDVPNILTLNNDGLNEVLFIESLEYFNASLQIYNRWGNLVFSSDNYQNNWNGKNMNGNILTPGTYFYTLEAVRNEKVINKN